MAEKYRPARVTIEARVMEEAGSLWVDTGSDHSLFTINLNRPGVTVEYLPEPREWRDGDVVQFRTFELGVAERANGKWYLTGRAGPWRGDGAIDTDVEHGTVRVLRYQAGEEQE